MRLTGMNRTTALGLASDALTSHCLELQQALSSLGLAPRILRVHQEAFSTRHTLSIRPQAGGPVVHLELCVLCFERSDKVEVHWSANLLRPRDEATRRHLLAPTTQTLARTGDDVADFLLASPLKSDANLSPGALAQRVSDYLNP